MHTKMENTNELIIDRRLSRFYIENKRNANGKPSATVDEKEPRKIKIKLGKKRYVKATIETNMDIHGFNKRIQNGINEYFRSTSLHGLGYVGDRTLAATERIFWLLAFLVALGICWAMITDLYKRYNDAPIIVALSPTLLDIRHIPFPAVTICNMNNLKKSFAEDVFKRAIPGKHSIERQMINSVCKKRQHKDDQKNPNQTNYPTIVKFFEEASQSCIEMIVGATWSGYSLVVDDAFQPTLTDEGMCCRFNSVKWDYIFNRIGEGQVVRPNFAMESFDWSPQRDYTGAGVDWRLPWRPQSHGSREGLTLYLDVDAEEYYCATGNSIGFKITLHNPVETVKMFSFASYIKPGHETRLAINPNVEMAHDKVQYLPLSKRNCFFENERKLRYYRTYSQRNCISECEANYTRDICGCVVPFMPRDVETNICEGDSAQCARGAIKKLEAEEMRKMHQECDCLEGCFEVQYLSEQSSSTLREDTFITNAILSNTTVRPNMSISDLTVLAIYFERGEFVAIERRVIFGFTELLSTTGGVFGLFTGFSFLSIVEIFYHLFIKLYYRNKPTRNILQLHQ